MAGNFPNRQFLNDSPGGNMSGMGPMRMNQLMTFMEPPGFNDQPLEFSGAMRNEPRIIDGENMARNEDDVGNGIPPDMLRVLQGQLTGNQWGMEPAMGNFPIGLDFMPGDQMGPGQFPTGPMDGGFPGGREPTQRILSGNGFTLTSPPHGRPQLASREKPIGCCTIFVGGLPPLCTNEMVKEIFENFGVIKKLLRVVRRAYCHIQYADEISVDKAFEVSGYRMRVEDNSSPRYSGVLRVDYSESRDDEEEYSRRQDHEERLRREEARLARREEEKSMKLSRHSDHEAQKLTDKLKGEETFSGALSILINWLDRGDCRKQTANSFFTLIKTAFSQTRRLSTEKQRLDDQIKAMTEMANKQTGDIYSQVSLINQVFVRATKQPSRDHFSKAQRKHIDSWKKAVLELCTTIQAELGLTEKGEADMDVSDEEEEVSIIKIDQTNVNKTRSQEGESWKRMKIELEPAPPPPPPETVDVDLEDTPGPSSAPSAPPSKPDNVSKEEAEILRCQLEAYRNEVDLLKTEKVQYADEKETQIKALQHALLGMQQQLMEAKNKLKKDDETKKSEKSDSETKEASSSKSDITSTEVPQLIEKDAMLVGCISTFLHVHPFGASVEYLWSYLQRLSFSVSPQQIEGLLSKFPKMFKQELFGVGATLEKRWQFIGYTTCMEQSPSAWN
ncbi:ecto-NOX disulfide-thiol exchanger 1-like isoform X1 [Asterias amurensis]|uniref:ecto-NOX disulfide-thiol exchanger 1-like isoform X1 n=1 Tax=Asterias amurensis TaxID=7602 RepID=UPI003AB1715E